MYNKLLRVSEKKEISGLSSVSKTLSIANCAGPGRLIDGARLYGTWGLRELIFVGNSSGSRLLGWPVEGIPSRWGGGGGG